MTVRADGTVECDGCGLDLGNGGIDKCVIVMDVGPVEEGGVRKYNFCREHKGDNERTVKGCGEKMLTATVLAHYDATHEGAKDDGPRDAGTATAAVSRATRTGRAARAGAGPARDDSAPEPG